MGIPEVRFHVDGTLPTDGETFVFGSNLAGIHGAGAAKVAALNFGAKYGLARGLMGRSYAIPTKDNGLRTLALEDIELNIRKFITFTNWPVVLTVNGKFFVTRVGCGLAGYKDHQIAPMFRGASNCSFAEEWRPYLEEK